MLGCYIYTTSLSPPSSFPPLKKSSTSARTFQKPLFPSTSLSLQPLPRYSRYQSRKNQAGRNFLHGSISLNPFSQFLSITLQIEFSLSRISPPLTAFVPRYGFNGHSLSAFNDIKYFRASTTGAGDARKSGRYLNQQTRTKQTVFFFFWLQTPCESSRNTFCEADGMYSLGKDEEMFSSKT